MSGAGGAATGKAVRGQSRGWMPAARSRRSLIAARACCITLSSSCDARAGSETVTSLASSLESEVDQLLLSAVVQVTCDLPPGFIARLDDPALSCARLALPRSGDVALALSRSAMRCSCMSVNATTAPRPPGVSIGADQ